MLRPAALLVLLAACSQPPEVTTDTTWTSGPCGDDGVAVAVQTSPGVNLTLTANGAEPLTATADADGRHTFSLPLDAPTPMTLIGERGGQETVHTVSFPPATLRNKVHEHNGSPATATTSCAMFGMEKRVCGVSIQPDGLTLGYGVPEGTSLTFAGNTFTTANDKEQAVIPVPLDALGSWDFSVFSSGATCPHLGVEDVEVKVKTATYRGPVWTGRVGAEHAVGKALGQTIGAEPWATPPTGDAALVVHRTSDSEGAKAGFARWAGEPGPVSDVRYLVRRTEERVKLGSCGIYTEERTGARREVQDSRRDLHLEIFERSTGELLASTTLEGKRAGCGPIAFGTSQGSALPEEQADRWIDAELARLRGQ